MLVGYTKCYLGSIKLMGAYCVRSVHNMLLWCYKDNGSILCMKGTNYVTLVVLR